MFKKCFFILDNKVIKILPLKGENICYMLKTEKISEYCLQ